MLAIGFPCKSISSQNNAPQSFRDADSTTGGGFSAMLSYIDHCGATLQVVMTENVRTMMSHSKQHNEIPIAIQDGEMASRGFLPCHCLVNTKEFGLPQSRTRCYGLYLRNGCVKPAMAPDRIFCSFKFQNPLPLEKVLKFEEYNPGKPRVSKSKTLKWRAEFQAAKKTYGKAWGLGHAVLFGKSRHLKQTLKPSVPNPQGRGVQEPRRVESQELAYHSARACSARDRGHRS